MNGIVLTMALARPHGAWFVASRSLNTEDFGPFLQVANV
jgi:hypothetical protein